jgi:hypothetical protein
MKQKKTKLWLIAVVGIAAGFLMGLWVGSQYLPRLQDPQISDLTGAQQDNYVSLVALAYDSTDDLDAANQQLGQLQVPNLQLLLSGVLERAASQGKSPQQLAALAKLALAVGVPEASLTRFLPTATPEPTATPTATPLPTQTPIPTEPPPTATPEESAMADPSATPTQPATATPIPGPQVTTDSTINVRGGPGTAYPVVSSLQSGQNADIIAKNPAGDWWQIQLNNGKEGWVYNTVVSVEGETAGIPVASNIPAPPATPTPAATATPTKPAGPDFRVVSRHLWTVEENEGSHSGTSVNCGGRHELNIKVVDAAGNPLNGVTIRSIYNNEEHVSGEKGPGMAQWILFAPGNGVKIVRDVDGRDVTSDNMDAPTDPRKMSNEELIGAGYCTSDSDCEAFKALPGCYGHYSWSVTFQRSH